MESAVELAGSSEVCAAAHILVVVSVDGSLTGISRKDGSILWSMPPASPSFVADASSPIGNSVFIPDPVNGFVYHYDLEAKRLQKLSVSLKELVNQPAFVTADGKYQTTSKSSEIIPLNPFTGEIVDGSASDFARNQTIFITKTLYVMNIHQGEWHNRVEYVEFEPTETESTAFSPKEESPMEIIVGKNGVLRYADNKISWKIVFPRPIICALKVGEKQHIGYSLTRIFPSPEPMGNIIKNTLSGNREDAYVGKFDGKLFLIQGKHFAGEDIVAGHIPMKHERMADAEVSLWEPETADVAAFYYSKIHPDVIPVLGPQTRATWSISLLVTAIFIGALFLFKRRGYFFGLWQAHLKLRSEEADIKRGVRKPRRISSMDSVEEASSAAKTKIPPTLRSITVSDEVLGFGSHGTVVYKGGFEGRKVAVKRLLLDFYDVAETEVTLLRDSDHHPNVIRYFMKEQTDRLVYTQLTGNVYRFVFIALELCPASLFDIIEQQSSEEMSRLRNLLTPKQILRQIMLGLRHLHSLKIVHRDVKPQNILFSSSDKDPRVLISDFGLCKKLSEDQSSFANTNAGGTVGWRAPECIDMGVESFEESSATMGDPSGFFVRVSKRLDIFSAGLVYYYVLSFGKHPFGDKFSRENNIIKGNYRMDQIDIIGEECMEAKDLIRKMISRESKKRPDADAILIHPFFWDAQRRLTFLTDVSDRLEIEERDPPSVLLKQIERGASKVVGTDWSKRIDRLLQEDLTKRRSYEPNSVRDLLRALRNKKHHYQDLPERLQHALGDLPGGFLRYFTSRFPGLFLHVYHVISANENLREDASLKRYFRAD